MVLKGCTKKVIVVKDDTSGIFEQAIFFVKPECDSFAQSDFVKEASRLIAQRTVTGDKVSPYPYGAGTKNKTHKQRKFLYFSLGLAAGWIINQMVNFII